MFFKSFEINDYVVNIDISKGSKSTKKFIDLFLYIC